MLRIDLSNKYDDGYFPVQAFFNVIPDNEIVKVYRNFSIGVGYDNNTTGCNFPGDLDPWEEGFEGVQCYRGTEDKCISFEEFYYYAAYIAEIFLKDNPQYRETLVEYLQDFKRNFVNTKTQTNLDDSKINGVKILNHQFLYERVRPRGLLFNCEGPSDCSWMADTSEQDLQDFFVECNYQEYILKLIEIFQEDKPGYNMLGYILGIYFEKASPKNETIMNKNGNVVKEIIHDVNRREKDIKKIVMNITEDEDDISKIYWIKKFELSFEKVIDVEALRYKIFEKYDTCIMVDQRKLVLKVGGCKIVIKSKG